MPWRKDRRGARAPPWRNGPPSGGLRAGERGPGAYRAPVSRSSIAPPPAPLHGRLQAPLVPWLDAWADEHELGAVLMTDDWSDALQALRAAGARFLVVGAHALAVHGVPRATRDLDLWVKPTEENATRVWKTFVAPDPPQLSP